MRTPIPINEAEAILEAFWDGRLSPLPSYAVLPEGAARWGGRARQDWCWTALAWDRVPAGEPVLTLSRPMEFDLRGYDRLAVRLSAPPHVRLTVRVETDGGEAHEFEEPLPGAVLRRLTLVLESDREGPEEIWLGWIGVAHAGRREAMLSRPSPFAEAWEGELLPPDSAVEHAPGPRCTPPSWTGCGLGRGRPRGTPGPRSPRSGPTTPRINGGT